MTRLSFNALRGIVGCDNIEQREETAPIAREFTRRLQTQMATLEDFAATVGEHLSSSGLRTGVKGS